MTIARFPRFECRSVKSIAALVFLPLIAGCAHVAPYERGMLAHPTMTSDDMATSLEQHVRSISEGATGGIGGGGGGCGCN